MDVTITGRHCEIDDSLRAEIVQKIEAAVRVFPSVVRHARVIVSENRFLHTVEAVIELTTNKTVTATAKDKNIRIAVNLVENKLNEQFRRLKERIESHHKKFHQARTPGRARAQAAD